MLTEEDKAWITAAVATQADRGMRIGVLSSKKFLTAVIGTLGGIGAKFGLDLDTTEIAAILSPLMAYIVGQGIADNGKEAAKLANKRSPTDGNT